MAKQKGKKSGKGKQRAQPISEEIVIQQEWLQMIEEELSDLHELALIEMSELGILPPLYGGEYLGEEREVIPLWGMVDEKPELGALLLRVMPDVEPNLELQVERDEIGLENDWPISELLDMVKDASGGIAIENSDGIRDKAILFVLFGQQIKPAPGYDMQTMIEYIGELKPYAVFVKIPVSGEDEEFQYNWDDIEHYTAEVIYADSPQLLEAAIWEYRLNHALAAEVIDIKNDGEDPDEVLIGKSLSEIAGLYDMTVLHCTRLYGTTSAIRTKQEELDILRDEEGTLIVNTPLKSQIEPLDVLREWRTGLEPTDKNGNVLFKADTNADNLRDIWLHIRPSNYYLLRMRSGQYVTDTLGNIRVWGFAEQDTLQFYTAETQAELFRKTQLIAIYEMLAGCGLVEGRVYEMGKDDAG